MPETEKVQESILAAVVRWVSGQPFNNVLTTMLVVGLGFVGYHGGPALLEEWKEQRAHFDRHIELRDKQNKEQRDEFLSAISLKTTEFLDAIEKNEKRCAEAIEREHRHAKELLERAISAKSIRGELFGVETKPHADEVPKKN